MKIVVGHGGHRPALRMSPDARECRLKADLYGGTLGGSSKERGPDATQRHMCAYA